SGVGANEKLATLSFSNGEYAKLFAHANSPLPQNGTTDTPAVTIVESAYRDRTSSPMLINAVDKPSVVYLVPLVLIYIVLLGLSLSLPHTIKFPSFGATAPSEVHDFEKSDGDTSQKQSPLIIDENSSSSSDNAGASVIPYQTLPPNSNEGGVIPYQTLPPNNNEGGVIPYQTLPTNNNEGGVISYQTLPPNNNESGVIPCQTLPCDNSTREEKMAAIKSSLANIKVEIDKATSDMELLSEEMDCYVELYKDTLDPHYYEEGMVADGEYRRIFELRADYIDEHNQLVAQYNTLLHS
ncbi:MAG: hypothetical protein RR728_07160, partial [Oscillospiraceae bacterium]